MSNIAELNDNLRRTFTGGRVMMTAAVAALDQSVQVELLEKVRSFADFDTDNDPYDEHDFGVVTAAGEKFFWKVDYFDLAVEFGSEDPSDPAVTTRVLTIMCASEY